MLCNHNFNLDLRCIVVIVVFVSEVHSFSLCNVDKPNPPAGKPAATNITGTSLTLSWYGPSYDGGSIVTDYRVEMCKTGDMNWKTLTSNCKASLEPCY